MEPTCFILLRHGETVANKAGILQGWYESPLDDNGVKQVECAAEYLKDRHIDAIYCSDLQRAIQTAEIAGKYHPNAPIHHVHDLREWNCGIFEGHHQTEIKKTNPEVINTFADEYVVPNMPGGETREVFQKRIEDFFTATARENPGKTFLVITHGGTMGRIFRMAAGLVSPNNRIPMPTNASVSSILYLPDKNGWWLTEWNINHYLSHLNIVKTLVL